MSTTVRTRQVSEGGVTRSVASQSDARFGNTRKVTADNQAVSGTFVYDAFGNVTYSSGSPGLRNRYCGNWGYRDDGDAGLLHVGARYYDPTTGRFTTRDTVLSEHPYVYCDGDPVNAVDPSGNLALGQRVKEAVEFSTPRLPGAWWAAWAITLFGLYQCGDFLATPHPSPEQSVVGVGTGLGTGLAGAGLAAGGLASLAAGASGVAGVAAAVAVGTGLGAVIVGGLAVGYGIGKLAGWW